MKRTIVFIILVITLGALLFSFDSNITKKSGWGTGSYNDIFTMGKYAYIAADLNGLDIIDIENPSKPLAVGNLNLGGRATAVHVSGNYAYVVCSKNLHIVDVSIPASPRAVGIYTLQNEVALQYGAAWDVIADGNYAYLLHHTTAYSKADSYFIKVLDVSNPAQPRSTEHSIYVGDFEAGCYSLQINGHYLSYLQGTFWESSILAIYDVSDPLPPKTLKKIDSVDAYAINGNYVYISCYSDKNLKILDIVDPLHPQEVVNLDLGYDVSNIVAAGNYLYLEVKKADQNQRQMQIIDVSNPKMPVSLGSCTLPTCLKHATVTGGTAVEAAGINGLYTFDISKPDSPRLLANYDFSWSPVDIFVNGNRAYVADSCGELKIFDITTATSPIVLGTYISTSTISTVSILGNYAYLATARNGLEIINVTDPAKPVKTGSFCAGCGSRDITSRGKSAYLVGNGVFFILDMADPAAPREVGQIQIQGIEKVHIDGNYAFLSGEYGLDIVDITKPALPVLISHLYESRIPPTVGGICSQAPYAYAANNSSRKSPSLDILDFSRPSAPVCTGRFITTDWISDIRVNGNYVYMVVVSGLYVIDVSKPGSPLAAGHLDASVSNGAVAVQGKYIYLVTGSGGRLEILEFNPGNIPPQLLINRAYLEFNVDEDKNFTPPQYFFIDIPGPDKVEWSLECLGFSFDSMDYTAPNDRFFCYPSSGIGSTKVLVSLNPERITWSDVYFLYASGYIAISAPNTLNSKVYLSVAVGRGNYPFAVKPFGEISTPRPNTVVSGSVPITGWALDNIGVSGVQIYREANGQLAYVGDAVFVEGARPDVEIRYPDYPNYFKAGWGYMLLTQGLPGGDGPLTLHAVATDTEGNCVTLGTTRITVANANSVKPFGAIDTPGQGETISDRWTYNWGWALTPLPNTIPTDGSTIRVWIDGIMSGQPVYNQYRQDLAELFPGLNNSGGAAGYFILDIRNCRNGIHTIAWSVEDDAGNADGIGSRYFQVLNKTTASDPETADRSFKTPINPVDLENAEIDRQPLQFKTGFNPDHEPETAFVSEDGVSRITIRQLERVEIDLGVSPAAPGGNISGYLLVGNAHRPLPIGSTLDTTNGIFYWQPGPGFVGTYDFIFVKEDYNRATVIKRLAVNIAIK